MDQVVIQIIKGSNGMSERRNLLFGERKYLGIRSVLVKLDLATKTIKFYKYKD